MKYKVELIQTLKGTVMVEANSTKEALNIAEKAYCRGEINLKCSNFLTTNSTANPSQKDIERYQKIN